MVPATRRPSPWAGQSRPHSNHTVLPRPSAHGVTPHRSATAPTTTSPRPPSPSASAAAGAVPVRDTENPSGPVVTVGAGAWPAFVGGLRCTVMSSPTPDSGVGEGLTVTKRVRRPPGVPVR
ncbi:DUF397 domain-containing protein [Streptomyces sp. NPDC017260]|uniref:DUF397 domain-containing protein n=1 Tax=unclassified Streptomyces TaxID=2593676 RepID=UPI0037AAB0DC